jgi:hypothetical protein
VGPRAKKAGVAIAVTFLGTIGVATEACRNATQVELVVTYSGPCGELQPGGVGFIVATSPDGVNGAEGRIKDNVFTTLTSDCLQEAPKSARIGTLVVTPNDSTDRASIIVMGAFGGKHLEDCKPSNGYFGCIVARRTFHFVEHAGLSLEISLDPECLNVPCDAVSTCSGMKCVDSNVDCNSDGCRPPGALDDGGQKTVDAPTSSDAYVMQLDGYMPPPPPKDATTDSPTDAGMDANDAASACGLPKEPVACAPDGSAGALCPNFGDVCCRSFVDASGNFSCQSSFGNCMDPMTVIACRNRNNCPEPQKCCLDATSYGQGHCADTCSGASAGGGPDGGLMPDAMVGGSLTACKASCECAAGKGCNNIVTPNGISYTTCTP